MSAEENPGVVAVRHRIRRRRRLRWFQERPRRWWVGATTFVVGALVLLGGIWVVITGLLTRGQLQDARADISTMRAALTRDDLGAAQRSLQNFQSHASNAEWLTSGPAWTLGSLLPGGGPLETVRGLSDAVDDIAEHVAPQLVDARFTLSPATLRDRDGAVDVDTLRAVAPGLAEADRTVQNTVRAVAGLPGNTAVGPVNAARSELLTQLRQIVGPIHTAAVTVSVAPRLLGSDRPRRYLVAFVNNAELRGAGGLPGGFGILLADRGKLGFEGFYPDGYFDGTRSGADLGAAYNRLWSGFRPSDYFINSNVSPHFPYAAAIWARMWQNKRGQHIDGAMSVDATSLGYLLGVSGETSLADGTKVTGGDVANLLQADLYRRYPTEAQNPERKAFLVDVAKAASTQVVANVRATSGLLDAVRKAVQERRILLWSADPQVERQLDGTAISGEVPTSSEPYAAPVLVNDSGGKLDYYVDRSFTWASTGCSSTRMVTATVSLSNRAPSGLPPYVTNRQDNPSASSGVGSTHLRLVYYATAGARLQGATIDGRKTLTQNGSERGHPVTVVPVELPRDETRTVRITLVEPSDGSRPTVLDQPGVRPQRVAVSGPTCTR